MKTKKMYREWEHLRRLQKQIIEARAIELGRGGNYPGLSGIAVETDECAIAWQDLEPLRQQYELVLMVRLGIIQRKALEFSRWVNYKDKKLLRSELEVITWKVIEMFNVPALSTTGCRRAYVKAAKMMEEYEKMKRRVYRKTSWRIACNGSVR